MAVPTRKEFEEHLSLIDSLYIEELEDKLFGLPALYPDVSDAISEINTRKKKALNKLTNSAVYLWLNNQHAYSLAMRSLNRGTKFNTVVEEVFEKEVNEVLKELIRLGDEYPPGSRHYHPFRRSRRYYREELARPLIETLLVYFYGGSIESIIQYQKNEGILLLKAKRLFEELDRHFDDPLRLEIERPLWMKSAVLQLTKQKRKTFKRAIDSTLYFLHQPVKRNDIAARERLMVFNLYEGLQHSPYDYLGSKATAIGHFLCLEGIENHISQRGIEKLIQGWKAEAKPLR